MSDLLHIVEVFSSIQGEGLYVGCRQVFVRLAGCNMNCIYCDTPNGQAKDMHFARIERTPGMRDFISVPNPISITDLNDFINHLMVQRHHSVSFTGGEPLCQADGLVRLLKENKYTRYLETNGTLCNELKLVLPYTDIISMDIKLPSIAGGTFWKEHENFLHLASEQEVFVKIVIGGQVEERDFLKAIRLVESVDRSIPVILQPVTPNSRCPGIDADDILLLQDKALGILDNVRVIPQTHKYLGYL